MPCYVWSDQSQSLLSKSTWELVSSLCKGTVTCELAQGNGLAVSQQCKANSCWLSLVLYFVDGHGYCLASSPYNACCRIIKIFLNTV